MKARRLIVSGIRQIEIEEFELKPIPDDGILVETHYSVISAGTELWRWVHGANPGKLPKFPRPTGYCTTGCILEVGKDVSNFKPGDRVAGRGWHASHNVLPNVCHKVPDAVSAKNAVFLNLAAIALHGIRVANIELGKVVAVVGLGLIGQIALSHVRLSGGLPLVAIDTDDFRLAKARARGADYCINPRQVLDISTAVREHCVEDGANVIIEASGNPSVYPMAIKLACPGGTLVGLGSPRGTVKFDFFKEVHLREVNVIGAAQPRMPEQDHNYYLWTKRREKEIILRLMNEGRLNCEDLITHELPPEQCLNAYTMLADFAEKEKALGVIFDWQEQSQHLPVKSEHNLTGT